MNDRTVAAPAHPALQDQRVAGWKVVTGIFGAPAAWLTQMSLSEPLAAQTCYPHTAPLPAPVWPSLQLLLAAITLGALALALGCTLVAWSAWRVTHAQPGSTGTQTMDVGDGRPRFLAGIGVLTGILFVVAILITGLAVLIVSPCAAWGGG